jgi:hypothetical protein
LELRADDGGRDERQDEKEKVKPVTWAIRMDHIHFVRAEIVSFRRWEWNT